MVVKEKASIINCHSVQKVANPSFSVCGMLVNKKCNGVRKSKSRNTNPKYAQQKVV